MTDPQFDPIAGLLREASVLDKASAERARSAFLERAEHEVLDTPRSAVTGTRWVLAPLALAAAVALAIWLTPNKHLTYQVVGASSEGGYVQALKDSPAEVLFSDHTKVTAAPGASVRVVETTAQGSRLSLERGKLTAHVKHAENSVWKFVAGPFEVRVTGTRFDLVWDPTTEQLHVELYEGSVEVQGYHDSGPVAVRAGQRFFGDARARTMLVGDSTSPHRDRSVDSSPDAEAESANEKTTASVEDPKSKTLAQAVKGESKSVAADAVTWSALVSQGKFGEVVEMAQQRGIEGCLSSCSSSDLGALADAARYTGRSEIAAKSLLSLRKRFAGAASARATFLLGRLYEGTGQSEQARTWYDTSLRESPSGSFASESLAGKMRATLTLQGKTAATPIAREYLRRYPEGAHAPAAQKIVQP